MSRRRRRQQIERARSSHSFRSLSDAVELFEELDYEVQSTGLPDQKIISVRNRSGAYDLTVAHDEAAHAIYLGTELARVSDPSAEFLSDILVENSRLNHAHISLDPVEGDESYRITATHDIRTLFLSEEHLVDEIRAFDSTVSYVYPQVHRITDKAKIELIDPYTYGDISTTFDVENG